VFKSLVRKKVIKDVVNSSVQNQLLKLGYNNKVSTITYRAIKKVLKFNVLIFLILKMGIEYKIVVILTMIIV
jgi:hypothetical protein